MTNYEILSNNGEWILKDLRDYYAPDTEANFIEQINLMSRGDILKSWLEWQGIIGHTDDIISLIVALFQSEDSMQTMNLIDEVDFDATLNGDY
jgi:hypothetical protein